MYFFTQTKTLRLADCYINTQLLKADTK